MPSVYIENLGCAKNQVDAEIMGRCLENDGWSWVDDPDGSDLIIVNTCGFIEPAQQESIDTALSLLAAWPETPVALAGCMAQRFAEELVEGLPEVVGVFGNREPQEVVSFVRRLKDRRSGDEPFVLLPDGNDCLAAVNRGRLLSHPGSVYVKIAEGCEHNCSFCAIPSIRGRLRTRTTSDILKEFRGLRRRGIHEFNLIAQDLAAWYDGTDGHGGTNGFPALLRRLLQEEGDFWLRSLYLYPDTFPAEVLDIAASDRRLVPYFDLSFQHASRNILRRMGRPGDAESYLRLVGDIRKRLPDVALRSSFIVGFPGESEDDVTELLDFLAQAELEWVGVFEFSPQTGTPAAAMAAAVAPETMAERKSRVELLQEEIVHRRLGRFVGRLVHVLVEERIEGVSILLGRSPLQAPDVDGLVVVHNAPLEVAPGEVVNVEITGVTGVDLQGQYRQ